MFNLGDRVRIAHRDEGYPRGKVGMTGIVRCWSRSGLVGIEMDDVNFGGGHDLDGRLENNRGYYVKLNMVALIPTTPFEKSVEAYITRELHS